MINSSSYKVTPRTATVGVGTADPGAYEAIMAAVATNNIDHVRSVASALAAGAAPEGAPAAAEGVPAEGAPAPVAPEGTPAGEAPAPEQAEPAQEPVQ